MGDELQLECILISPNLLSYSNTGKGAQRELMVSVMFSALLTISYKEVESAPGTVLITRDRIVSKKDGGAIVYMCLRT